VDLESDLLIQDAIRDAMQGRTTLIIAHRLSTIRQADTILVLDRGQIVEEGPHGQLIRAGGLYSQLYERTARL